MTLGKFAFEISVDGHSQGRCEAVGRTVKAVLEELGARISELSNTNPDSRITAKLWGPEGRRLNPSSN